MAVKRTRALGWLVALSLLVQGGPAVAQEIDPDLVRLLASGEAETVYARLEFGEDLGPVALGELPPGVRLIGRLERGRYLAALRRGSQLRGLRRLRRAHLPEPKTKIRETLGESIHAWAQGRKAEHLRVVVQFFPGVPDAVAEEKLREAGLPADRVRRHGPTTWAAEASREEIARLSELHEVRGLPLGPVPFIPLTESSRFRTDSELVHDGHYFGQRPFFNGADGSSAAIGIFDKGIDELREPALFGDPPLPGHFDFYDIGLTGNYGGLRVTAPRMAASDHGTRVASIAAGSGLNSASKGRPAYLRRGHAPFATLGDYDSSTTNMLARFHGALVDDGMDVTNHSYVQSWTVYDAVAAELDSVVRGDAQMQGTPIPPRPQVWAAGNNGGTAAYSLIGGTEKGYTSVFTSAKNPISVGSVDARTGRLSSFSSLGPTYDGRIKPDLVAPGARRSKEDGLWAAQRGSQGYSWDYGTSMSAPVVSGVIALMIDRYQSVHKTKPDALPSTYKALLIHTATDLVKSRPWPDGDDEFDNPDTKEPVLYHRGPDYATGWGLVNAEAAVRAITRDDRWAQMTVSAGAEVARAVCVLEGAAELKITIAWDDPPGPSDVDVDQREPKLVNDLDLVVLTPGPNSEVRHPWLLEPFESSTDPKQLEGIVDIQPAGRGVDERNNVEMVQELHPAPGCWAVKVSGTKFALGGSQTFSLVSSEPLLEACPCP